MPTTHANPHGQVCEDSMGNIVRSFLDELVPRWVVPGRVTVGNVPRISGSRNEESLTNRGSESRVTNATGPLATPRQGIL